MSSHRTAWHPPFVQLLEERSPPGVQVEGEVILTQEPQKADLVVVHEQGARLHEGRVLRRLWPMLSADTIIEFKSVARPPRDGDWARLLGYGAQYHSRSVTTVGGAENLSLVMVTASMTTALRRDTARMGWSIEARGQGYFRISGASYRCFLVLIDHVAEAEHDRLLAAFGHRTLEAEDREVAQWLMANLLKKDVNMSDLEGWEELVEKLRQAVPPEQLLKGMKPEERSTGLAPEETVLLLADDVLRRLPRDFIDTLPEAVRAEVLRRIGSSERQ